MNYDGFKYFTMQEMCQSNTANRLKIDNWPRETWIFDNIKNLVWDVLDPLREKLGMPVIVNCGYRSKETNTAVGGATNSQHMKGEAADIRCKNLNLMWKILKEMNVDQCIYYRKKGFIHVSYVTYRKNRNQYILN